MEQRSVRPFAVLLVLIASVASSALPAAAAVDCPVTIPNRSPFPAGGGSFTSTHGRPPPTHGNDLLWVGHLSPDGVIVVREDYVKPDGSISLKFPWARRVIGSEVVDGALTAVFSGQLEIDARRLDAPAPQPRVSTNPQGVHVGSVVIFPSTGCWEVTGRAGTDSLTIVFWLLVEGQPVPNTATEQPSRPFIALGVALLAASIALAVAHSRVPLGIPAGAAAMVVLLLAACASQAPEPTPSQTSWTRGPIPESARLADGSIDMSQVPDFIPATDGDGTAGWVASADVLPPPGESRPEIITVFADDLATVVGHMYPEVGFVPLEAEAGLLPPPGQDRDLTIFVRNESDHPAILEITEAADQVDHRPLLIAPPITLEAGDEREVRFQAPRDRWSLRVRGELGFFFSDDLGRRARDPAFALVITAAGVLEIATAR